MAEATFSKNQTRGFTLGIGGAASLTDARYVGARRGPADKANWTIGDPNEAGEVAVTFEGNELEGAEIQLIVNVDAQRSVIRAKILADAPAADLEEG